MRGTKRNEYKMKGKMDDPAAFCASTVRKCKGKPTKGWENLPKGWTDDSFKSFCGKIMKKKAADAYLKWINQLEDSE